MLKTGERMPDFSFDTPFETGRSLGETAKRSAGRTGIVFLRYYGCTLCQYDIHRYAAEYGKITERRGQLLIVLQSDRERLAGQMKRDSLPFDIICDPKGELYKRFEIHAAASKEDMMGPGTMEKIQAARAAGFSHGDYEGEELQLPAAFVVDRELKICYAHYGKTVDDIPSAQELGEILGEGMQEG